MMIQIFFTFLSMFTWTGSFIHPGPKVTCITAVQEQDLASKHKIPGTLDKVNSLITQKCQHSLAFERHGRW